jgi:hypothetical protein
LVAVGPYDPDPVRSKRIDFPSFVMISETSRVTLLNRSGMGDVPGACARSALSGAFEQEIKVHRVHKVHKVLNVHKVHDVHVRVVRFFTIFRKRLLLRFLRPAEGST